MTAELLVNIDVDDLEKAIAFYRDGLGFREGPRLRGRIMQMFRGEMPIFLIERPTGSAVSSATSQQRDYKRHWTPVHLDFVVEDIALAVARAAKAGARQESEVQSYDWGRMAVFSDPFGHGFCLIEFSQSGYETIFEQ